jgi:hypothetical protein
MIPMMHIVGACGFRSFRAWLAPGRSDVSTRLDARVCPACGASRMLLRTHAAAHGHGDRPLHAGTSSACAHFPHLLMKIQHEAFVAKIRLK